MMISSLGSQMNSIVNMLNTRAQTRNEMEGQLENKTIHVMLNLLEKKNQEEQLALEQAAETVNEPESTPESRQAYFTNLMKEKGITPETHLQRSTNAMIELLKRDYLNAQVMERYENLAQDEAYREHEGMQEIFQYQIDHYRFQAVGVKSHVGRELHGQAMFDEANLRKMAAAQEQAYDKEFLQDNAAYMGFHGLDDLFALDFKTSSASDIKAAIQTALKGLGAEGFQGYSPYEVEKRDAHSILGVADRFFETDLADYQKYLPEGGISFDLNKMQNGGYTQEELIEITRLSREVARQVYEDRDERCDILRSTFKYYSEDFPGLYKPETPEYVPIFDLFI